MFTCFICKTAVAWSVSNLFAHFKSKHGLIERSARYDCCQDQCCRTFSEKYAFSRHLAKCHKGDIATSNEDVNLQNETVDRIADVADGIESDSDCDNAAQNKSSKVNLKEMAMLYACEAKSRVSTLENVNYMVNSCSGFVSCVLDNLLEDVSELFKTHNIKDSETLLKESFEKYKMPFEGIDKNYNQITYLKQKGFLLNRMNMLLVTKRHF